jgi:AraC family transcriptional activator of pobA
MKPEIHEQFHSPRSKAIFCQSGLEIHDLQEWLEKISASNRRLLQTDTFLMIWLIKNQAIYCLYAGQMKFFRNGYYDKGYVLSFASDFICSLKSDIGILHQSGLWNLYQAEPTTISLENSIEMGELLQNIVREYFDTTELRAEMLRSLLKILIIKLSRRMGAYCLSEANIQGDIRVFKAFQDLVSRNFMTMKKVSDYAEALGMAPNYLNTKVKKVSGFTASHHIHQRILQEAKRQANWEGMSLKQIAYGLGFDDLSHFSKFFKKAAGINFTEFKRVSPVLAPGNPISF